MKKARVRSLCIIAGIILTATVSPAPAGSALPHTAVHRSFLRALAPCAGDAACASAALTRATRPLAAHIAALPRGRGGVGAWLRVAASLGGSRLASPSVPRTTLADAVTGLWRQAGYRANAADLAALRAQAARLDPVYSAAVARLVNALRLANDLAASAIRGSGLERIASDPVRAARLIGLADAPWVSPDVRRAAAGVVAALARVDMDGMTTAAAVVADALAAFGGRAATQHEDVDVPLVFVGGEGDNTHAADRLLLIDMGGNDTYTNNAGGGVFGVGGSLAADLGDGADVYSRPTGVFAQGFGLGVPGILYDEGGSDRYDLYQFGQGGGVGGVGILYDAGSGDDVYDSAGAEPIGTKAAALGGVGVLVDEGGRDTIHQDGLDGFVWGGAGVALMANLGDGRDIYRADAIPIPDPACLEEPCPILGTFAGPIQVSAEANGAALLYEEGGDDSYVCGVKVRQGCQGSAGGGSFGMLWDRAGNDSYWMGDSFSEDLLIAVCDDIALCDDPSPLEHPIFPMGQGAAYGACAPCSPAALGILYDEDGADSYTAARWAQGFGTFGGLGILSDGGGDPDSYAMRPPVYGSRSDGDRWLDGIAGLGADG